MKTLSLINILAIFLLNEHKNVIRRQYLRKISWESRQIISKKVRKSKWDSFNEFVNILREYVENDYYGGFEVKIEDGRIVDSKDWRRRKYKKDDDNEQIIITSKHILKQAIKAKSLRPNLHEDWNS